jgi:hypothetical protein
MYFGDISVFLYLWYLYCFYRDGQRNALQYFTQEKELSLAGVVYS